ncbi:MAG: 6-bladed beta-propeller [Gemmatimonadota bacterium]
MGDRDGPGIIEDDRSIIVKRSSAGLYFVAKGFGTNIKVFDASGRYLRTIGRSGQGPGEFHSIAALMVTPGDSLLVVDNGNRRLTVYSPAFALVRTTVLNFDPPNSFVYLGPDAIVTGGILRTPDRIGLPLHHVGSDGNIRRSFGGDGKFNPVRALDGYRVLSVSADGSIWIGRATEYTIEKWTLAGKHVKTLRPKRDWFVQPPPVRDPKTTFIQPPPLLSAISEHPRGWLIAAIQVPSRQWRDFVKPGLDHQIVTDAERIRDSRIELLSPDTGELISHLIVAPDIYNFPAPDLVSFAREESDGTPRVVIARVVVDPNTRR